MTLSLLEQLPHGLAGGAGPPPPSTIEVECAFRGDFNRDCQVHHLDLAIIRAGFGVNRLILIEDEVISQGDLNSDGTIDNLDLAEFITLYRFRSLRE